MVRIADKEFRVIFDASKDGLLLLDGVTKRFSMANAAFCQMLGCREEEIAKLQFMDLTSLSKLTPVVDDFARLLRGRIDLVKEIPVKRKDGSVFYAEATGSFITLAGKPYLMASFRDITERKNAEIELEETREKLIRSDKLAALGKLAGIVGHELRNPLGAIRNSVYFLRLKLDTASQDEKIKRHLEMMDQEINNSDRIISDILFFSRVKQPIFTQNDLNEILKASLKKVIINPNIEVETKLAELPLIPSDENQLVQVFTNIILNAAESMPKGGKLTISSFVVRDSSFVAISIKDTGEGISKENLSKLFEPLFSTKINGTGLGMVVCKSIIESHKGYIRVESPPTGEAGEKGKGTLVTVELPVRLSS